MMLPKSVAANTNAWVYSLGFQRRVGCDASEVGTIRARSTAEGQSDTDGGGIPSTVWRPLMMRRHASFTRTG